jgi:hypothetical protein
MVFWWRYKIFTGNKFTMDARANYSMAFKTIVNYDATSETSQEIIRTTRYWAGALTPNYQFNKYIGVGMYLFYTRGIEEFITRNTYMVALRPSVANIPVTKNIAVRIVPEIYYLKMDDKDGVYLNTSLLINKKNFPLSISALANRALTTNIPADYDYLWNVGLIYAFNSNYVKKK